MYAADILKAVHLREISNMSVQLKDYEIKFLILIYAYEFPSLVAKILINAKLYSKPLKNCVELI